jgi:hypothetical protein
MKDDWNAENYDSGAYTSTGLAAGYPRFQGVRRINQKLTTPTRDGWPWTILTKKYGGVAMLGTVARGTYVLVLTAMIVAWAVSLGKEAPAEAQPNQQIWYIYS